jgi:ABC-2 type transport system ATP-binding protein
MFKMDKSPVISVNHVSKNFVLPHEKSNTMKTAFLRSLKRTEGTAEVQHALRDISLDIHEGEFFGIVGRNGSGKSTLLKILAGIYQPNSGSISVTGRLVPFIELGVGFNGELTGRENVYLNGALLGFSQKEVDGLYEDIVGFAELEQFMDQKLKNYSSGMQVRLAFSLATRVSADILLVDEVLAVGDADFQRKCFDYFKQLKKSGTTVVFVTHDMDAVREYCDRAILVNETEIAAEGTADEIAAAYIKLFNDIDTEEKTQANNSKRWGDNTIHYDKPKTTLVGGEFGQVKVSVVVHILADLEAPIFGFSVSDAAGVGILGTNTRIKQQRLTSVKSGETIELEWEFNNLLADGLYTVDLTAHHADGVQVYDWWEEATSFRVKKEERTAFPVTPDIKVSVKKAEPRVAR